jgi:UDP-N-acetylmuramate dehydrogenase
VPECRTYSDNLTIMQVEQNVPLAPLTTLKVGGPARFFVRAEKQEQVVEAVAWAETRQLQLFVLGGGSNLVISDAGWSGLVLQIAIGGIGESNHDGKQVFAVGAGVEWDAFVAHAVSVDCGGIECMSGIPGTVGGTPIQNVGAYGQEVSETIRQVEVLDLRSKTIRTLPNEQCGFSYRSSIFNQSERGRYIVLSVSYALDPGAAPHIEYADLKRFFAGKVAPSLAETREAVRQIRRSKAMLIVEGDPDAYSAGSFFKNPMVTKQQLLEISARPAAQGENVPSFPGANGQLKVSAAWLVEHAGFRRGYTRGNVGISSKHALAIVNRGDARAAEVVALQQEIQERVFEAFGVNLVPEPVFVGFE